jgi:hypothetical protein
MAKSKTFDPDTVPAVTLAELEAATGLPREVLVQRLNGTPVALNWAGQRCIPMIEARAIVERVEQERRAQEEAEARRLAEERAERAERQARFERYYAEELQRERERVLGELSSSNVVFHGLDPLSPADRRRAAERARERLAKEGKR